MEHVTQDAYNPHAFITVRRILPESNDNMFLMYKATEVEEMLNRINLLEQRLEAQETQMGQILNNLTADGWYSENVDKEEVLSDLCEILGAEPSQEMNWSITVSISGTTEVPLTEVSDFDIRYHLADVISIDSNSGDTVVDSWDVDHVDSQDWQ